VGRPATVARACIITLSDEDRPADNASYHADWDDGSDRPNPSHHRWRTIGDDDREPPQSIRR
jgi:hypothetical protein